MSFYALVCPVKHRPGFQEAFKRTESMFDLVQVFVMIKNDSSVQFSHIGCDCKEPVILLMPFDLLLIDLVFLLLVIFQEVMRGFLFK